MKIVEHTPCSRCWAPLSEALHRVEWDEVLPSVTLLTNWGNRSVCEDCVKKCCSTFMCTCFGSTDERWTDSFLRKLEGERLPRGNDIWTLQEGTDAEAETPNTLATWCEEPTHWKRPWCWGRLRAGGEGGSRGWDGWMASLTQWSWVWVNCSRWCRTGKPGVLRVWVSESRSVVSDSLRPCGLYSPWNSPGQDTGMGSLSLLQGIFPTQGSNPGLPHCRRMLYQLSHKGSFIGIHMHTKKILLTYILKVCWNFLIAYYPSINQWSQ